MWPANNPSSNRQAPKRNHKKVDYQNEKDRFPKLLFHFWLTPFPIFDSSLALSLSNFVPDADFP